MLLACLFLLAVPLLAGCPEDGPAGGSSVGGDGDGDGDGDGEPCGVAEMVAVDESSCEPLDTDYTPATPQADPYPTCISDSGTYELVADPPGALARVMAYEAIAELLWNGGTPTPEDFIAARTIYEADEGLRSRVDRREDLHYPPIPESEWNAGLDDDKQCADPDLVQQYPQRCAGPSRIRLLVNQALIDGIDGVGDPLVNAARVEAGLLWFFYLSIYKEAFTCTAAGNDCDSMWAKYTGGEQVGGGIGFSARVERASPSTHGRIFDAILAVRCWRDLYPDSTGYDTLSGDSKVMFDAVWEQLDQSLHRGLALIVRVELEEPVSCGPEAAANWVFVQIGLDILDREASERDADLAEQLRTIAAVAEPTPEQRMEAVALLDEVFPCP